MFARSGKDAMSESTIEPGEMADLSRADMQSALFAQMIMQLSNMAMMLLGKVPDPQSGQTIRDLEAAKLFIDQLEVLEAKTKGNLTKEEDALLKQTLMALRLTFVEAVESPQPAGKSETTTGPAPTQTSSGAAENKTAPAQSADAATEESSGKRFSKKYSS
jgi:hypothetical protein